MIPIYVMFDPIQPILVITFKTSISYFNRKILPWTFKQQKSACVNRT